MSRRALLRLSLTEEVPGVIDADEGHTRVVSREVVSFEDWAFDSEDAPPVERELRERLVREGVITRLSDGAVLTGTEEVVARMRLARAIRGQDWGNSWDEPVPPPAAPARDLIPGLWPWGTVPTLGGNPKAGKTLLVVNLTAALVVPGRRFLGRFEPVTFTDTEREGEVVVVVNTETPRVAFEAALERAGVALDVDDDQPGPLLRLVHLADEGGPGLMDLTDPEKFDYWVWRLTQCDPCDGSSDFPPVVVVVDNMTSALLEVGKGPGDYAEWFAQLRRLLRAVGVPNGLAVGHSFRTTTSLLGGVENAVGQDGLWAYTSADMTNPGATRWFSVVPRIGGYPVAATRVERRGALLHLDGPAAVDEADQDEAEGDPVEPVHGEAGAGSQVPPDTRWVDSVRQRLREAASVGLMRTEVTGRGRYGTYRRSALDWLIEEGEVVQVEVGRNRFGDALHRCWLVGAVPA
jgi:hypothetical protein